MVFSKLNKFLFAGIFSLILSVLIVSCSKEAGEGGTASIKGKVYGDYYNKSFTTFYGSSYVPDKDVYIIYGDDASYGERVRTSYDGSFEFKYLRKGDYKVFVYSIDSTLTLPSGLNTILKSGTIDENGQELDLGTFKTLENK